MTTYRVGIIGCGQRRASGKATGAGISHNHAHGYAHTPDTKLVALADIRLENAQAFQAEHGGDTLYTDYKEMLAKENLDIVSVCVWPFLHPEMVIAAAEAGVKAVHCEKPMALTFGEAKRMVQVCQDRGVQLDHALPLELEDVREHGYDGALRRVRRARLAKALEVLGGPPSDLDGLVALAEAADRAAEGEGTGR